MSLRTALKRLTRGIRAQDEAAVEKAVDELEDLVEEHEEEGKDRSHDDGKDPDEIEIHNHIPDHVMDAGRGEMVEKDPPGFSTTAKDAEAPPWFKQFAKDTAKQLKGITRDVSRLKRRAKDESFEDWAEEESEEGEHQKDQKDRRDNFEEMEEDDGEETDRNMDRGRDRRRSSDEPAEREEMAERIKEQGKGKDGRDEANQAILGQLEFEAPPGTNVKDAKKARDSAFLEDSFQDVVAKAEIIAPGIRIPTFDAAAKPVATVQRILALRRTALDLAYGQAETRGLIDAALGGREFSARRMDHGQARLLFNSVASAAAASNNTQSMTRDSVSTVRNNGNNQQPRIRSIADINATNRERYSKRTA